MTVRKLIDLDEDERRLIGPYLTVSRPSGGEYRGFCRECEEPGVSKSPSASYNFIRGEWHCMKNDCGGTIAKLMAKLLKAEKAASVAGADVIDIETRRKQPTVPLPDDAKITEYEDKLHSNPKLLAMLGERRGLTPETLRRFRIGWEATKKRFTIPVYTADGTLVNVRLYNMQAKGDVPKMLPFATGYGTHLYNEKSLAENDEIVLCEGEWDCQINEQNFIPTVTHTGGAGAFQMGWAKAFKGKHVFICYDEDEGGVKGAIRTARMLREVAAGVYIMNNLGTGKKSGDITDFYLQGGSEEQFRIMKEEARLKPFALDGADRTIAKSGKIVTLEESQNTEYVDPLELSVLIAGKQTPPFLAPRKMRATCDQAKGKMCAVCPMAAYNGERTMETLPDDSRLLQFIGINDTRAAAVRRTLFGAACSDRVDYEDLSEWGIEELVVVQSLENRSEETMSPMHRKVFSIGTYRTGVNTTARLVGQQVPHPQDKRGIFHAWYLEPTVSDIDKFVLEREDIDALKVFQHDIGQSPLDKCREIAEDLSANVTKIYGRSQLHVAYDVVWHSALDFKFMGSRIDKGWLDAVVVGDTRTGKSETAKRLRNHYQVGIVKSCEGATFAGLVGGAQPAPQGGHWMVTWGVIPLNDRRLVVLDELSGLIGADGGSKGIIEQMSTIRSSGKAELTKIVSEETSARTRLLWITNPVDGKRLADTPGGGMEAIRKLVKSPEDVARFDFAFAVSNSDVPSSLINVGSHAEVEHIYNTDLCNKLLMWVWSRKADQIKFVKGAEDAIMIAAEALGDRYVPDPPLVQVENIRMKLARIAVAIAARTFSTNRVADEIWVRPDHIAAAVEFLDWLYNTEVMGYARHSKQSQADRKEAAANKPAFKRFLAKRDNRGMLDALRAVMYAESFRPRDFEEFGGIGLDARDVMTLLLNEKMVRRLTGPGGRIVLEPALIEVLKELEDEGV